MFASKIGVRDAVAVSSGTAALHSAVHVLDLSSGDEVIVPAITFIATANAVLYEGGIPVFTNVEPDTFLLDPGSIEKLVNNRIRAVISVDYAGQPCDYDALNRIAEKNNITLIADACHAPGASYKNRPVGSLADLTAFSFHPVKHITTGEGGMISCHREEYAEQM